MAGIAGLHSGCRAAEPGSHAQNPSPEFLFYGNYFPVVQPACPAETQQKKFWGGDVQAESSKPSVFFAIPCILREFRARNATMKLTNPGTVPVYTIAGAEIARPLPDWLARRRNRSFKSDPEYRNRVELLQDFEFEEASSCVRTSEDGNWVMSTGTYKPQIHVHYLPHLALSFARHTTSLNVNFLLLSQDYSKSIHLQSDRKLELHTPAGCHYELRLPRYGRDLVYDRISTEVLIPSVGVDSEGNGEAFRLNLEHGRFMKSYQVDVGHDSDKLSGLQGAIDIGSVNCGAIAEDSHNLLAFGTSIGTVEFRDTRSKDRVAKLEGLEGGITALDFCSSGHSIATGSSEGVVQIFDLRRAARRIRKDQGYGYAIKNLIHLTSRDGEKKILSADKRIIKIWDELTGEPWTSIEPAVDINFVSWCKNSGMLLTANEGKQQHCFFIPQLGAAPPWCTYLDHMVDDLTNEASTTTYDNYRFLDLAQLKDYSLDHLIGKTNLVRPYMHGYFVASDLYEQARLIANMHSHEEEQRKKAKEKGILVEQKRFSASKKVPVNQKYVDKLLKRQERREKVDATAGLLGDNRFSKLFEDAEFAIDETSREFKALNPSTKVTDAAGQPVKNQFNAERAQMESDADGSDGDKPAPKPRNTVVMREYSMYSESQRRRGGQKDTSFGSRIQKDRKRPRKAGVVGEQHMSFVPERRKPQNEGAPVPVAKSKRLDIRRSASSNVLRRL